MLASDGIGPGWMTAGALISYRGAMNMAGLILGAELDLAADGTVPFLIAVVAVLGILALSLVVIVNGVQRRRRNRPAG
jgi:hypothetical protein